MRTPTMCERLSPLGLAFAAGLALMAFVRPEAPGSPASQQRAFTTMIARDYGDPQATWERKVTHDRPQERAVEATFLRPVALLEAEEPACRPLPDSGPEDTMCPPASPSDTAGPECSLTTLAAGDAPPPEQRDATERSEGAMSAIPSRFQDAAKYWGLATCYHPSLEGWTMANSEPYDPSAMTAAGNR